MNKILWFKFVLTGDKFMPELYFKELAFIYLVLVDHLLNIAKGSLSKKILKDKAYEVARKEGSRIRSKCKLRTRWIIT